MRTIIYAVTVLILSLALSGPAIAEDTATVDDLNQKLEELQKRLEELEKKTESDEVAELKRQVVILAEEVEKLRSGEETVELEDSRRRSLGLGPAAASVYSKKQGVSIAGYGEMLYQNFADERENGSPSGKTSEIDFVRAIVYFGYRFNDRALFNSEIEFEHASTERDGSVSVEFAHIDYELKEDVTLRGGMVLIPMGFLNEFHEPTVYLGARRTLTESFIIPSTWRENGFGVVGRKGIVDYRAYLVNGFDATGFSAGDGLRGGRQRGGHAAIRKPSFVGRVDVSPAAGLLLGGSFYAGESGVFSSDFDVSTIIGEAHAEYRRHGFELRGLYAHSSLDNVTQLNNELGLTGSDSIGEAMSGGYLQAGYNLLAGRSDDLRLTPYLRFESINTQADVPSGFIANPANDRRVWTLGAEFRPLLNVVIKSDYQFISNEADSGISQFNLLLGYSF